MRLHQPRLPWINSDEPPPNVTTLLWASEAHHDGTNCFIYSTLSHAAGQTGLQTPRHKLQVRTCRGQLKLANLCVQKMKTYILMDWAASRLPALYPLRKEMVRLQPVLD